MKAYFVASVSGRGKYLNNYSKIVKVLKDSGTIVSENIIESSKEGVYSLTDEQKVKYYKQVLKWISKADYVVAEVSYPSIGVGYEISLALEKMKPVIVLHEKGDSPHFLKGINSEKLLIVRYKLDSLRKTLLDTIDSATEQMDSRFNFFISPKISNYLDWIARKKRIPRAVYLRRLIEKDIKKGKKEAK